MTAPVTRAMSHKNSRNTKNEVTAFQTEAQEEEMIRKVACGLMVFIYLDRCVLVKTILSLAGQFLDLKLGPKLVTVRQYLRNELEKRMIK